MRADVRAAGERQAIDRAGPWPHSGTAEQFERATARAVREACRTGDIEYRVNRRFRLWLHVSTATAEEQLERLAARRCKAIQIAEEREWLLQMLLCDPTRGSA